MSIKRAKEILAVIEKHLEYFPNRSVYNQGWDIYELEDGQLLSFDLGRAEISYSFPRDNYDGKYTVTVRGLANSFSINSKCSCTYTNSKICRHAVAAMLYFNDELQLIINDESQNGQLDSEAKELPLKKAAELSVVLKEPLYTYDLDGLTDLQGTAHWQLRYLASSVSKIRQEGHTLYGEVAESSRKFPVTISMDKDHRMTCTCICGARNRPLCRHGYALLTNFGWGMGRNEDILFPLRDHTGVIVPLLAEYGFTLKDDWNRFFTLEKNYPDIKLIPLDPGLSKISEHANWEDLVSDYVKPNTEINEVDFQTKHPNSGVLWSKIDRGIPRFQLNLLTGKRKKNGDLGSPLRRYTNRDYLPDLSLEQRRLVELLGPLGKRYSFNTYSDNHGLKQEELLELLQFQHQNLLKILPEIMHEEHYLSLEYQDRDVVAASEIARIFPQSQRPEIRFELSPSENFYLLKILFSVDEKILPRREVQILNYGIIQHGRKIYLLDTKEARTLMFFLDKKSYKIRAEDLPAFQERFLNPLMEQYEVSIPNMQPEKVELELEIKKKVYLKEVEEQLLFIPAMTYQLDEEETREVFLDGGKWLSKGNRNGDNARLIRRDKVRELEFYQFFQELHPRFANNQGHFFALPITQVMQDNWFFKTFDALRNGGFEIMGLKGLTKLNYSPYRPQVRLQAGSGTDWFDIEMEVKFGEQTVKLSDIRRAVLKNQNYVQLGDGSIGMLPEEWIKKYSNVLKIGKVSRGKIEFSQFQLSLIDELYNEIGNVGVLEHLFEKRAKLQSFKEIKKIPVPKKLKAKLRNYQKAGYNWLNFLDEFGWGGCLADDMGLGKTVQVLAFLSKIVDEYPDSTHLVVVPRSLVFNWLNEIEKFTPHLTALRHTGQARLKSTSSFKKYQIILTTYGLARSDVEMLRNFQFHYVVLDESQAIKNPTTQTAKAVKLLQAKNRLIMTGTPVENNTFDLYSQMDFVNPGMLGNLQTFKREFANRIDKDKDEEIAKELRKIVYPFILSRKKGDVAKELPPKTETVLYCEMAEEQRKVYDHFRTKYRELLIEKMETEGMNKAGMYILQGLLKLRQICNSPQLLSENEGGFTSESTKLERLTEMLLEIISQGQKVLVFSFFKGMLAMIGDALENQNIDYVKLTGESQNREELVETFKTDESKRAFLISLKAGGFGLNLSEANYVFLVDPWWNPAVEQQAIDRTHRIGQTQHVFAYKLICKDTIEEKILKIQEKKQAIANELVHTEAGFLKQLKPEDVKDLFS